MTVGMIQDGELFTGIYEVNINGDLQLPYLSTGQKM